MAESRPRSLRWYNWLITRLLRQVLILLVKLRISRVKVTGRKQVLKSGAFIVASNHISVLDPVYLWGALRRNATAIAMQELWSWPVIGRLVSMMGHIPVKRGDRASGERAIKHSIRVLEAQGIIMMYPEGGISRTGQLRPFKIGVYELARATGAKVVPAGIRGTNQVLPASSRKLHPRRLVTLAFGEPLDARDFATSAEFLHELSAQIAQLSGLKQ